jgi:hypothetical protein
VGQSIQCFWVLCMHLCWEFWDVLCIAWQTLVAYLIHCFNIFVYVVFFSFQVTSIKYSGHLGGKWALFLYYNSSVKCPCVSYLTVLEVGWVATWPLSLSITIIKFCNIYYLNLVKIYATLNLVGGAICCCLLTVSRTCKEHLWMLFDAEESKNSQNTST